MIPIEYGRRVPTCDNCGEHLAPCDSFQDAIEALQDAGWVTHYVNGEWENYCPVCQEVL